MNDAVRSTMAPSVSDEQGQRLGRRGHEKRVNHAGTEETTHIQSRPVKPGAVRQNPAVQVPGIGSRPGPPHPGNIEAATAYGHTDSPILGSVGLSGRGFASYELR